MTRPRYDIAALAGQLYDKLAGCPVVCEHGVRGLDIHAISAELDVPTHVVSRIIRFQRLVFADDEINIPYHVCGRHRVYHLSASLAAGERWLTIRLRGELAHLAITIAWWQSMVNAHPDSTVDGQLARINLLSYQEIESRVRMRLGQIPGD
jgi:hypothetical protein